MKNGLLKPGDYFLRGNYAFVEGALLAGCRFFAGYPITPSNEISAMMARRLPQVGGAFIQFEDEIASVVGIIGAANGGVKSMTATSGPGFSLMQEAIGLAFMIETPIVIVDVQRGGPSTGLPTQVGQGDFIQANYGSHGDYETVVYLPNSPQEMFDMAIKAFNTAWRYRVPVIVLADQMIGQMIEKVSVPPHDEIELVEYEKPEIPPEEFLPFDLRYEVPPFVAAGDGYRIHLTGLAHDERGYPTTDHETYSKMLLRKLRKIWDNADKIVEWEERLTEDSDLIVVSYGITSRSVYKAVSDAREKGLKVGIYRLKTAWPFPYKRLKELAMEGRDILVVEVNMGQAYRVVRQYISHEGIYSMPWAPGRVPPPEAILKKIEEVYKA